MNKKLKLFSLLALTLALGAGAAWAFATVTLPAQSNDPLTMAVAETNVITGKGTHVGGIAGVNDEEALKLEAAEGDTVAVAPKTASKLEENGAHALQVIVNNADGATGTVVMKASNGDNPVAATYTKYTGGTVLEKGVLGVTNSNSLGQRWIAVLSNADAEKTPVFRAEGANAITFGNPDEGGNATKQPFFFAWKAQDGFDDKDLRYVAFDVPQTSSSNQGLSLRHGLDQRAYTAPTINAAAADTYARVNTAAETTKYVRLVKKGDGRLYINGGIRGNLAINATDVEKALDGAFHWGGTTVEGGVLEVMSEADANANDHYRASLGRTWKIDAATNKYQGSHYDYGSIKDLQKNWGKYYNPLKVANDGRVKLNKSQFFTDFNVDEKATFQADDYTLATPAGKHFPQIAVVLGQKDSYAKGLLTGEFDLVLDSMKAEGLTGSGGALGVSSGRPKNDPESKHITQEGYAVLYIDNENNTIGAERETEVADGVLEIAGAKSIGGGQVDVGASSKRGFATDDRGVFAASKTFRLPNVTKVHTKGMLAAEAGTELSFKDVTIHNLKSEGDGSVINPQKGSDAKYFWDGTVTFGPTDVDSGDYYFQGTVRNPSVVTVQHGVWQLNSYPSRDVAQTVSNEDPYATVVIDPDNATLSLGDGVRDFRKHMTLTVHDDSRIRMVLKADDIVSSRADAMGKDAVFHVRLLDVSGSVPNRQIGQGEENRDNRLVIQLDASKIGNSIKSGWVKALQADNAIKWNDLHFLRENSNVNYEDYAKVRVTWSDTSDLPEGTKAVAHLDENSNTILIEFGADVNDPVNPGGPTPPAPEKDLKATVTAPAEVKLGTDVTFELGKWTYKASADVEVQDVKWMLDGVDKTADVKDSKLTVKAEKEGTMNLVVTAKLKADPTVDGEAKVSVAVKKDGSSSSSGGSSGGCDAGFAGLGLLLAAPLFLRKRD